MEELWRNCGGAVEELWRNCGDLRWRGEVLNGGLWFLLVSTGFYWSNPTFELDGGGLHGGGVEGGRGARGGRAQAHETGCLRGVERGGRTGAGRRDCRGWDCCDFRGLQGVRGERSNWE